MKSPLLQLILSGLVLGAMGGAAIVHTLHLSGAKELSERGDWPNEGGTEGGRFLMPAAAFMEGAGIPSSHAADTRSSREQSATVAALEEIVERLRELKLENEGLVGQLEETNRHLMELEFRVDSHSESFRPLRVSSTLSESLMLLPPKSR